MGRLDDDLAFAHELADAADAVTMRWFRSPSLRVDVKPDLTPVSHADRAAEEAVRSAVAASGRGEAVLGEEAGGGADREQRARWIVDPVDGTKSYVRGVPVWATLLALERAGTVDVALVSAPALGRRWWATRGGGAFASGERCAVSRVARIEDATVSATSERSMPPTWAALAQRAWAPRGWADFWQHCLVAEGAVDAACESLLHLWDFAAVRLLVEEAGGRCTTFAGGAPSDGESFVSSNGVLHDEVLALLGGM